MISHDIDKPETVRLVIVPEGLFEGWSGPITLADISNPPGEFTSFDERLLPTGTVLQDIVRNFQGKHLAVDEIIALLATPDFLEMTKLGDLPVGDRKTMVGLYLAIIVGSVKIYNEMAKSYDVGVPGSEHTRVFWHFMLEFGVTYRANSFSANPIMATEMCEEFGDEMAMRELLQQFEEDQAEEEEYY